MKDGSIFCLRLYLIRLQIEKNNNLRFLKLFQKNFEIFINGLIFEH